MDTNEIMKAVNPVALTAEGCLIQRAATGNIDAANIMKEVGITPTRTTYDFDPEIGKILVKCFASCAEVRYEGTNNLFRSTGIKNFIDVPCGYTPRGLELERASKNYIGCDLPYVINKMGLP